ncbi:FAD-dependent monooxygenase [Mycolicibacterium celeriflavum]|uniref:FAD-dependent monooxygenase n=1 Tax=Mycolicibacterium celeriflavum TaxID=1249101 RepID=UPI0009EEF16F|nr:FAD-dependent monooxygenase [Mycolicibacterium celeriflavum]
MVISQAAVEGALRDRLAALGGEIHWGTALADVRQEPDAVTAVTDTGDTIGARWLIGCDGAASVARSAAGIDFPGVRLTERFLLADLRIGWDLDRSGTTGWIHQDGMIGVMPMPGGLWRIIAYDPDAQPKKPTQQEILARLERIIPERTGRSAPIEESEWLSMFTVHRRLATTYRRGRVLIAGDAAHTHAPFGGQGMLTGLGDAENLAWKLALVTAGRADEKLLNTYEAERRPLATEVLRGTSAVTKVNVAQSRIGRLIRDRVVVPVMNLPAVQRWATYRTSQLWVAYRHGPLARRSLPCRGLRPGDRVPGVSGAELHGRWGLLGADDDLTAVAINYLGADSISLIDRRINGDALLVRPDGHLAWRGRRQKALHQWLSRVLTTGTVR